MIKKIFLVLLLILAVLVIWNYKLVSYGIGQGVGQLKIVWNAKPVSEYLEDSEVPDSVKQKLNFVGEVRKYAVAQLGLVDTENYTSMYDQKGEPLLWVVTGCEPFSFTPKEWEFPILGTVPYKGFFDKGKAERELAKVKGEGLDASIRTVGGWSTLGWFNDPILSKMLERDWGDLANLIIHELVHSTIFVKDSVDFNENLASFIAHEGTILFLKDHYGLESEQLTTYQQTKYDDDLQVKHILRGTDELRKLYNSFGQKSDSLKWKEKNELIKEIMNSTDTLSFFNIARSKNLKGRKPDNTYFMSYMRYEAKRQDLSKLYEEKFNQNLTDFITHLKQKHPFL